EFGKFVAAQGITTTSFETIRAYLDDSDPSHVGLLELMYEVSSLEEAGAAPYLAKDERLGNKFRQNFPVDPHELRANSRLFSVLTDPYRPWRKGERHLVVIQVTASDDVKKPVSWDKAREVFGSAVGHKP